MPTWALAFGAALVVALVAVGRCRRLALEIGFVDVPSARKSHAAPVPYLGGVGLIAGALVGMAFEFPLASKVGLIALAATLLAAMGLVDDDRTLSPRVRFAVQVAAALLATGAGLRISATAMPAADFAITVLWIVGITNAINLLDNMDALAAGITALAATAVFALAVGAGQPVVATFAASTAGACLGFLAFNRPPASVFMGDTGSLFLGFMLAVITIDVDTALQVPRGFLVPLMILAIPVLDTSMVTLARLRRGRSVMEGGRDHLSHRLVARGSSPRRAVATLLAAEAMLATVAVLAGRDVVPLGTAAAVAVVVLAAITARTARARVYSEPVVGLPRRLRRALLVVAVALPLLAAPALVALARAAAPARSGAQAAVAALDALERGDAETTAALFESAQSSLGVARARLSGPLVSLGSVVPVVSSNLRAARTLSSIGEDLAREGQLLASTYTASAVRVSGGAVPVEEIRALSPLLDRTRALVTRSRERLRGLDRGLVAPPLLEAVSDAQRVLERQEQRSEVIVEMARLMPGLLGADGPRRYFLAFQNNAELRGSGGFMGNWGVLVADDGRLRLERFGRLDELNEAREGSLRLEGMNEFLQRWRQFDVPRTWQQVNVSPDFPTTARAISQLYPQSGGSPVDGVIAVDPFALARLLELTGPVSVPSWDTQITPDNLVDVTLRQAYEELPQHLRVEFLGEVANQVATALTTSDIGSPAKVGSALGKAVADQHVKLWMADPAEQALVELMGADGALGPVAGDSLMVVTQNMAANKIDYYLQRSVHYEVRLQPHAGRSDVEIDADLTVTLENGAPPSGLPSIVIGPYDSRFEAGENRAHVSAYTPLRVSTATVNGEPAPATTDPDLGRSAHSLTVSVPAGQAVSVAMGLTGSGQLSPDGWYRLDLLRQPAVNPDRVSGRVTLPEGWRVAAVRGAQRTGSRTVTFEQDQRGGSTVWVRVERSGAARLLDQLARVG
jgi:UDP-GlcNAc:undecaprenyl-phosphate/decaprenyl-phosphate GlcNAc-1-phosphate transferase